MKTHLTSIKDPVTQAQGKRPASKPLSKRIEVECPFEKAIQEGFNKILLEVQQDQQQKSTTEYLSVKIAREKEEERLRRVRYKATVGLQADKINNKNDKIHDVIEGLDLLGRPAVSKQNKATFIDTSKFRI